FKNRNRWACHREPLEIKGRREQSSRAGINQVTRGHIAGVSAPFDQGSALARLERLHANPCVIETPAAPVGEEHGLAARKNLRPAMGVLSLLAVRDGQGLRRPSSSRDLK